MSRFHIPRKLSDNFYEECSIEFMEQEYIRTSEELEDISAELRFPFSSEGRIDNGCRIVGCFSNEEQRRLGMSRYYVSLKNKQKTILEELKKEAMIAGMSLENINTTVQNLNFDIREFCNQIDSMKLFKKHFVQKINEGMK